MKDLARFILFLVFCIVLSSAYSQEHKVRVGVAGMTHGHVNWILNSLEGPNYVVVGFAEENDTLVQRLFNRYNIPEDLRFQTLAEMIQNVAPDGVLAFNSIFGHLEVVETCAPEGIHVMVEKPLAVSPDHSRKMAHLAKENNILLLTNYETTWYGTTTRVMDELINKKSIGEIRKVVVRDGHQGPMEIGVNNEFFAWLTDPILNGGGALIDFGCYGANLITKIMKNQRPTSVSAITQQIKPLIYPKVDDEATIILTYPRAQGIIQASWNWPMNRKDMDVYGTEGIIYQYNGQEMTVYVNQEKEELEIDSNDFPEEGPFSYFSAAILKDISVGPDALSSLENNLIVVEILDAARRSATRGKRINLKSE
jgi:predicted dehydrogenase